LVESRRPLAPHLTEWSGRTALQARTHDKERAHPATRGEAMPDTPSNSDAGAANERGLTRGDLLRAGAGGAVLLGAGGLLGPKLARAARLASPPKKGGTMRIGIGGGGATDDFD